MSFYLLAAGGGTILLSTNIEYKWKFDEKFGENQHKCNAKWGMEKSSEL